MTHQVGVRGPAELPRDLLGLLCRPRVDSGSLVLLFGAAFEVAPDRGSLILDQSGLVGEVEDRAAVVAQLPVFGGRAQALQNRLPRVLSVLWVMALYGRVGGDGGGVPVACVLILRLVCFILWLR
ncbi:hypothetical protein ACFY2J_38915 [Streptomyces collinus]|uniref:hypothetical protein n=1 Tax=Streptomyces collinus TaxID=42684 RepID=UPI00367D318F